MPNFHQILIQLRKDLGYATTEFNTGDNGICVLYAEEANDAWLSGEKEFKELRRRLNYIQYHYHNIPKIVADIKQELKKDNASNSSTVTIKKTFTNKTARKVFDAVSFFELGELYQFPRVHQHFFGKTLTQQQIQDISFFAQPPGLRRLGGRARVVSFSGVYTPQDLVELIKLLRWFATSAPANFVLSIGNGAHRIGLCYSPSTKMWQLNDVNQHDMTSQSLFPIANDDPNCDTNLYSGLMNAFNYNASDKPIGFSADIFTTAKHQHLLKPRGRTFLDSHYKIFPITPEHANVVTNEGVTLLWLAALKNNHFLVRNILQMDSVDIDHSNHFGNTPTWLAASFGYIDTLRLLINARTTKGEVNLNRANKEGVTPLSTAASNNQEKAVQALVNAKTRDGQYRVNLDQPDDKGRTPLYMAVINGYTNIARILIDAKTPDGKLRVNLNHASSGGPLIFTAITNGYREIAQLLIEAGVDLDVNLNGSSPLQMARMKGLDDIAVLIEQAENKPKTMGYLASKGISYYF